jgi:ribonuclease-3
MIFEISEIENLIGYSFKDKNLLRKCFTHSSFTASNGGEDNEVLEFFGDAIMDFIVTEHLFKTRKKDEGELTVLRSNIVSKEPLLRWILKSGLHEYLILGKSAKGSTKKEEKMYSSLYEAIVAGIYLDGGIAPTKKFIKNSIIADFENGFKGESVKVEADYKSAIQEYVQKQKIGSISYQTLSKSGPDHKPTFRVAVLINGTKIGEGEGSSKKYAEAKAAKAGLDNIIKRKTQK